MQGDSNLDLDESTRMESAPNTERSKRSQNFSNKKRKRGSGANGWSKREEDKILKYALKLSEKEFQNKKLLEEEQASSDKFSNIEEGTVYLATEEDFLNPIKMFDDLWAKNEDSSGVVKIIPPEKWLKSHKANFESNVRPKFEDPMKKLLTRKQILNELYAAKKFDHSKDYNYQEYTNYAKTLLESLYPGKSQEKLSVEEIEEEYWKQCSESQKPLTVLYAADIPTHKYFSKQELYETMSVEKKGEVEDFSLLTVNTLKNSFLQFMKANEANQISGITIPWFYFGMMFSSFCWHTEDLYLYSLNYMHEGKPKIWYSISHTQKAKMDEYIKNKYFATYLKQPDLIHRLTVHISPLELMKNGIKVYRFVQNPGEIIVTLPKGYHCGFSTGLNIAEAVNFSSLKWVEFGLKAQNDYRKSNRKLPVFSMEWIIMQNFENLSECKFDDSDSKRTVNIILYSQIKKYVNDLISDEVSIRTGILNFFKQNKINYTIEEIDKNDASDRFECDLCTYSGYLSQLQCNNCKRKGCLNHNIQCKCLPTNFTVRYRYQTKSEEIQKKVLSSAKSKYLKTLGFFNHFAPTLGVIPESQNEYNDELFHKRKTGFSQSFSREEVRDLIVNSVKNNNIQQFRELMEQYDNFDVNALGNSGWNVLHYACFFGYLEIALDLITKHKANVNVPNIEEWTPLHLCSFKGHQEIVKILLSNPDTNVNSNVVGIGTPLHCACKKNHLQVVSILLFKVEYNILDSNGNLPIYLTTDRNIKKLINKFEMPRKTKRKTNEFGPDKYSFMKSLDFTPPKPPKTFGFIQKMGKFVINFHNRFIEIDPIIGSFRSETIPLRDITSCKKIDSWYSENKYFYFELIYKYRQVYRVKSLKVCEKWIEIFNRAIIYNIFWNKLLETNPKVSEYLFKQKDEVMTIEWDEGANNQNNQENIQPRGNKVSPLFEKNNNTSSNISKGKNKYQKSEGENNSKEEKKKKRRANPYSQPAEENDEDIKLLEDASLTKGITFNSFEIIECLGSGTFGKVFKVKLKDNNNVYAMKIINKKFLIKNQQLRYAVTECNVLKQAKHPFIITLHYAFQTPDHLYMILDYCPGGDFSYHIVKNLFEEDEAKFFIAELVLAMENLHNLDIIYRDLKPENILIDSEGHIRLADFGLAKENVSDNKIAQSFCGSPAYLAPEMVNRRGVGKAADIYGIGAVLYEMISGTPPFYAHDLSTMYKNIAQNNLMMPDYFSEELKDLLKKLLNRDPKNRIGVNSKDEIKNHEFFSDIDWEMLYQRKLVPPINLVDIRQEFTKDIPANMKDVTFVDRDYQEKNADYNRVKNFTFVRPHSPKESLVKNNLNKY